MQVIILGILVIVLGIQAVYLKNKSRSPGFKSFSEPYQNRLAKLPSFAIGGIFVIGLTMAIVGTFRYNPVNKSNKEVDYNNIKTLEQLKEYVIQNAKDKCEIWHRDNNLVNETSRAEKLTYDDNWIYNFKASVLPTVVENNDLPNSFIEPAREAFEKALKECGYEYKLYH